MKKLLKTIAAATLLAAALAAPVMAAETRVATVDMDKLVKGYWKTKEALAGLKDEATGMTKEGQGLQDDMKKATEEYRKLIADANDQAVSSEERDRRKKLAETKVREIKNTEDSLGQFERRARATLDEKSRRIREKLVDEINVVVSAKAKAGGYSLVLDSSAAVAPGVPVIVFSSGSDDLTDGILGQLNVGARVETPKETEKK